MTTEAIWNIQGPSLYFFILKRVQDVSVAEDILQNTFIQVHEHLHTLKNSAKAKPWVFQIARNELAKHFRKSTVTISDSESVDMEDTILTNEFCCFERFIDELPKDYQKVVELVYLEGKTNEEVSKQLNLSLANVKARIRRAKNTLKKRFQECCNFKLSESGKLEGSVNCIVCDSI
ncbi:MAG: sigma-70 family RNA polymerase sigma factor [Bacteroidota bacterium]